MTDPLLEMALIGYEAERERIEAAIAAIRKQVDGHAAAPALDGARRPERNMSAAARHRIAAAQRQRWAAFHAEKKDGAAPKRKLSAAARARTADLAKARAAKAAKAKRMAKAA